jgi:protein-L-isoaspartate(D-aspartate) O-methyltransferase
MGAMDARAEMVREIESEVRLTRRHLGKDALDPRVVAAMGAVPRHDFVAPEHAGAAYVNAPLPIGDGQTISQPYMVAVMTDMIAPEPDHIVLEIGTGCGYQSAILAELVARVHSIEIIPELGRAAAARLADLGYTNVEARIGDGREGWPEHAPYDGILVTAAGRRVPETLVEQLRPGGRMAIPVGGRLGGQSLLLVEKDRDGGVRERVVLPVAFVPLVGGRG